MRTDYKQLEYLHQYLRNLLSWLEHQTGIEFTNTSNRRIGDKGVHGTDPCRGYDLRMRNQYIGEAIAKVINSHWIYDPERPHLKCAVLHGEGADMHLHLQVHNNTDTLF